MQPDRSKKLGRQFKKYLGEANSEDIVADIIHALKAGRIEEVTPDRIAILEQFPKFIDAVENSYNEYEDRLKVATRNIEISSRELTTAYANLENLNITINAMLDSLGQGLLFFDREGICSSVYSKSCLTLLETDPSSKRLSDVLNFSEEQRQHFQSWLPIVFSGDIALDFDDMKKLLPQEMVNSKNLTIELDYRPMYMHEDVLMGILLIATDVTSRIEAEKKMARIQDEAHKIQQISRNRNGFHRFLADIYSFLNIAKNADPENITAEDRNALLRQLHTFKGYASTFGLQELSGKLHATETDMRSAPDKRLPSTLKKAALELEAELEREKELARSLFGPDFMTQGRILSIEMSKIEEFTKLIAQLVPEQDGQNALTRFLTDNFLSIPIFNAFISFERELARVAEHMGKPAPECHIRGENLPIVFAEYEDFFNVLIHLARNISDHGIEAPDERRHKGKPAEGRVTVEISLKSKDRLRLVVKDDGQGIDAGKIRHKLKREKSLDLREKSDDEVLAFIFSPDFSMKKEATMISGRGIGMNAIQDVVIKMGGTVSVTSGGPDVQGTAFIFDLPYKR